MQRFGSWQLPRGSAIRSRPDHGKGCLNLATTTTSKRDGERVHFPQQQQRDSLG